ncbi:MAG: UDP-N-acetylglucosamine 2-epimerase (non-hydrolyzing) [Bacteroidetes bacterium]|nr:UDP-N-acetylglucosamine 2-epimerase (non-hydrolyzing) [Bacteroidota bacterium]
MLKILTIIGARPQIIKAAALSRAIRKSFGDQIQELLLHTGQHYDQNMSEVFFEQLKIPRPDYNLNVGSGSHGKQTATMISGIEEILLKEKPDYLVVYGDTNSTLAGAIAASKIHVPIAHIEAGLRSFNKSMPEEINRIMCDHASTLLFSPTLTGIKNLEHEGFNLANTKPFTNDKPGVFHCGDVMFDNSLHFASLADQQSSILAENGLENNPFILSTIHRDNNTDQPERLSSIFEAICAVVAQHNLSVVLPLHPRTAKLLQKNLPNALYQQVIKNKKIILLPPVSFLDMIALEKNAKMVMTDSGGVQKEAYYFMKPCIIMRPETEWVEIVEQGAGKLVDADMQRITEAVSYYLNDAAPTFPQIFGDGKAAEFICSTLLENKQF